MWIGVAISEVTSCIKSPFRILFIVCGLVSRVELSPRECPHATIGGPAVVAAVCLSGGGTPLTLPNNDGQTRS